MIEFLEQCLGIAKLADKAGAWEAVLRTLAVCAAVMLLAVSGTAWLVHFIHRRATNLAEREVKIVERERALADTERDHAINNQKRAEEDRNEQHLKWKESERIRVSHEGRMVVMQQDHHEELRKEKANTDSANSKLEQCSKEMVAVNGAWPRRIWDSDREEHGVRVIAFSREHAIEVVGQVTFHHPAANTAEWIPRHFKIQVP